MKAKIIVVFIVSLFGLFEATKPSKDDSSPEEKCEKDPKCSQEYRR